MSSQVDLSGMGELTIDSAGVTLSGEQAGEGKPVVLLHGLTSTRRYVVMGSKNLERGGHRVINYDARGHGASTPAPDAGAYTFAELSADLLAVLDGLGIERAVLAGNSMGGHTALRFALEHSERVAGLVIITPAFEPQGGRDLPHWDALSAGLRNGGPEGFLAAMGPSRAPESHRETIATAVLQRMRAHAHPDAVADALRVVPRASAFGDYADLAAVRVPTVLVASRDDIDYEHPYAVAERYAAALPTARTVVEDVGKSPLAWQGGRVSALIAEVVEQAAW